VLCKRWRTMALRRRPVGAGAKPPGAALAEDRRGERQGKGVLEASGRDQEDAPEHLADRPGAAVEASLVGTYGAKTEGKHPSSGRAWREPADWPGGARRTGGMSLVCCSCTEREKASVDTAGRSNGPPAPRPRQGTCRGSNRRHEVPLPRPPADRPVVATKRLLAGVGAEPRGRLTRTVRLFNWACPGGDEWT
jgi:hypothetical protein